jgi:hypothetical protein
MELYNEYANPDSDAPGEDELRQSLLAVLQGYLSNVDDFYKNLMGDYDSSTYDNFEWMFIKIRFEIKSMLMSMEDPYYRYISRSENRKQTVNQILQYATEVATWFQNARKANDLDRPNCTDSVENLIYAIKNLLYLINK